jgi:phosphohistidine phosphatase
MELYILRHGIAEETSHSGKDRDRALTTEGREKTRAAARALRRMEVTFDTVLSSPFVRAWQTAEIIAEELGCQKILRECEALSSGAPLKGVIAELGKVSEMSASVLAVGHEPDLSRLVSVLLCGSTEIAITMKKGGLAKLTCERPEPGNSRLEWLLGPKHLSRLG